MITLVEFLEARLAEDEAIARSVEPLGHTDVLGGLRIDHAFSVTRLVASGEDGSYAREGDMAAAAHFRRHNPARVLREVEAKRWMLRMLRRAFDYGRPRATVYCPANPDCACNWCIMGRGLALPYSDHPDWREEWRP